LKNRKILLDKIKSMKSDFYFDPKEIHYMASREAADISFHQEIRKKMRSE
jgi:hypothetical protein